MKKIVLFIKSYKPDFERVTNLLNSIKKHNIDNIPVYLSVNDIDYDFFKQNISFDLHLIKDSEIVICNIKDGWRYQQIIKAQFHKLKVCENYLCIDSDSLFIRDFQITDFMFDLSTPYTIMHESKSFLDMMEYIGHDSKNIFFINAVKATRSFFNTTGKFWDYGPSPYLWSTKVWQHFEDNFLVPNNYTFESFFIKLEETALPSEAIIYGEYLLKTNLIPLRPIEGFFKVYHYKEQFLLEKKLYNIDRLKINYMGIIFQSNWSKPNKNIFYTLKKKLSKLLSSTRE